MQRPAHILPVVVLSQFMGTSVWFATNAVMPELKVSLALGEEATVWLTGAVQFGFIVGSALLSATGIADRVSPRRLFLAAAAAAAAANLCTLLGNSLGELAVARFACGLALAGVYPIGMKVAAGWFKDGLGAALGWLVGALVVGTALPHLLRALATDVSWTVVVSGTSALALGGGIALALLVPDGPYLRAGAALDLGSIPRLWRVPDYRAAALGYFGHMWELYTFWAMVPVFVAAYTSANASLLSFSVIAIGALGCVVGGALSQRLGSAAVARAQLAISGLCCLVAPLVWTAPEPARIALLLLWGTTVVGDSPQFSALTAKAAPAELVGTGLAFATAIGFGLTVISLQVSGAVPPAWLPWALLPGPLVGLWAMRPQNSLPT